MDRKVKVRPDQAYRIRELAYLSGGIDQLQLSELKIYKAWKDFLFQCLCEMEELGLLKSIQTYPLGIISDPPDDNGNQSDCDDEYDGSADQYLKGKNKEVMNVTNVNVQNDSDSDNDRRAVGTSQTVKICPVVHLISEQTERACNGNQSLSDDQLMRRWQEFFLQVLWELQQDGLIKPICTAKFSDHQTSNLQTDKPMRSDE